MKRVYLLITMLIISIVAAFNLHLNVNDSGDIFLQNIEVLSYGETSGNGCLGQGSVDCSRYSSKARFMW